MLAAAFLKRGLNGASGCCCRQHCCSVSLGKHAVARLFVCVWLLPGAASFNVRGLVGLRLG